MLFREKHTIFTKITILMGIVILTNEEEGIERIMKCLFTLPFKGGRNDVRKRNH